MSALSFVGAAASFGALLSLLASCASSGLYYMSDDWCARHLDASAAHCPQNQKALVSKADSGAEAESPNVASR